MIIKTLVENTSISENLANEHKLRVLGKIPIDPSVACDDGSIEDYDGNWLDPIERVLEEMEER